MNIIQFFPKRIRKFLGLNDTPNDYTGNAGKATVVNAGEDALEFAKPEPKAHAASHENGGADEINVDDLSGELADDQPSNFLKLSDTFAAYVAGRVLFEAAAGIDHHDDLFWDNVNKRLGIGINTPSNWLEIFSTDVGTYLTEGIRINRAQTRTAYFILNQAGGAAQLTSAYTNNYGQFLFRQYKDDTSDTKEAMRIQPNGNVGIGTPDPKSKLHVVGAISSGVKDCSASADDLDVAGVNTVFVDTSGGNVVLGGLSGGVAGQHLIITHKVLGGTLTLEYNEPTGEQKFFLVDDSDEGLNSHGGWTLVCDGNNWYGGNHAKHV